MQLGIEDAPTGRTQRIYARLADFLFLWLIINGLGGTLIFSHIAASGTNGSLLLTMLLHAGVNNTKDIVPSATPGATNTFGLSASLVAWLTVAVL